MDGQQYCLGQDCELDCAAGWGDPANARLVCDKHGAMSAARASCRWHEGYEAFAATGVTLALAVLWKLAERVSLAQRYPAAEHNSMLLLLLALNGKLLQLLQLSVMHHAWRTERLYGWTAAFTAGPWILDGLIAVAFLVRSSQRTAFKLWLQEHKTFVFPLVVVLGTKLAVLRANLFHARALQAPWTQRDLAVLNGLTLASTLLGDLPRLALSLEFTLLKGSHFSTTIVLSVAWSTLLVMHSLVSRALGCFLADAGAEPQLQPMLDAEQLRAPKRATDLQ